MKLIKDDIFVVVVAVERMMTDEFLVVSAPLKNGELRRASNRRCVAGRRTDGTGAGANGQVAVRCQRQVKFAAGGAAVVGRASTSRISLAQSQSMSFITAC